MRLKLGLLTLAIALVVVAGVATGIWLWAGGQAMAETGAPGAAVEKSAVPKAHVAKADDDDEEEAADDDDEDGDDEEEGDHEDKDDEVTVTLDQVPAPVRDAIRAEAGDNPIKKIEAETKNGQTIYEAEWVAGGKEVELKLSADGKIIKKKVEDADDDDDKEEERN